MSRIRIAGVMRFISITYFTPIVRPTINTIIPTKLISFKPIKFSKPGIPPQIKIWSDFTEEISADNTPVTKGSYCRIYIADNGIGFNEHYLDKIFTMFQRLHGRTEYEGTGIGLSIVKKIIEKHNGIVTARSQEGQGTTFIIVLPVKQTTKPATVLPR